MLAARVTVGRVAVQSKAEGKAGQSRRGKPLGASKRRKGRRDPSGQAAEGPVAFGRGRDNCPEILQGEDRGHAAIKFTLPPDR